MGWRRIPKIMTIKTQPTQESPSTKLSLKEARKEKGLSLEEVSKKLRISKLHLATLEAGTENLTCDVYTLGFLRSYATFLGLNGDEMCKKLREHAVPPSTPQMSFPAPLPGKGIPSWKVLVSSFCVLLAIIVGWKWSGNFNAPAMNPPPFLEKESTLADAPEVVPPPAEAVIPSRNPPILAEMPPSLSENISTPPTTVEKDPPLPSSHSVILNTSEEDWIEVKDEEGNIILRRLFKPSETYEFEGSARLLLKTGNARGTHLISGEKTLSLDEAEGAIQSNIPLDPQKWVE